MLFMRLFVELQTLRAGYRNVFTVFIKTWSSVLASGKPFAVLQHITGLSVLGKYEKVLYYVFYFVCPLF